MRWKAETSYFFIVEISKVLGKVEFPITGKCPHYGQNLDCTENVHDLTSSTQNLICGFFDKSKKLKKYLKTHILRNYVYVLD